MSPPARVVPAVALWLGGPPVAAVAAVVLLDPGVELAAVVLPTAQPRLAVRVTVAVALRQDSLSSWSSICTTWPSPHREPSAAGSLQQLGGSQQASQVYRPTNQTKPNQTDQSKIAKTDTNYKSLHIDNI